jgi:hypothetical protein
MNSRLRLAAISGGLGLFIGCGGTTGSGSGTSSGSPGAGTGSTSTGSTSTGSTSAGSTSAGSTSTGTASGSSSTTGGSCPLVAGTYTLHFSLAAGSSPVCPMIPDQMTSVTTNESPGSGLGGDAGMCTTTQSGCTFSAMCAEGFAGGTTDVSYTVTVSGGSAMGTETVTSSIVIGDASTAFDCSYGLSFTKD